MHYLRKVYLFIALLLGLYLHPTILNFPILLGSALPEDFVFKNYTKIERYIPMRDGTKLFTAIYIPKDISPQNKYPILMQRTCYSVAPYGENNLRTRLGPSEYLMRDKYIFVYQDVRGRYKSEGLFVHMPPFIQNKKNNTQIDEASDTYDAIDWLVKKIPNNNGRVGIWGISYPGYYTAVAAMCGHPALKAVSPQAPVSDFFFDDFHHNGAFLQSYFLTFPLFGIQKTKAEERAWFNWIIPDSKDGYQFYYKMGALKNGGDKYYSDNFFWQDVVKHPNYDEYWHSRSLIPQFNNNVKPAVMVVGGWFDAEDLYGPLNIYRSIETKNPNTYNTIVMAPFGHGGWSYEQGHTFHNDIYFGDSIASFYQKEIEHKFFTHFLKGPGNGETGLPEAYMFNTGAKLWQSFDKWPVAGSGHKLYFSPNAELILDKPQPYHSFSFISDPQKPVPSSEDRNEMLRFTPFKYMSGDQRFASERPDVLVFESSVLTEDMTFAGPIKAHLFVSTTANDADWIVKVIDVYPPDEPSNPYKQEVLMANYQQMVRSEVMRGRFRKSFSNPEPFIPNTKDEVNITLQDILHTFKKGHKIMVQIQSSWFPLIDRNPQKYVDNIYQATDSDFIRAIHTVFNDSYIEMQQIPNPTNINALHPSLP